MPKPQRTGYSYEVTDRTLNTDMEIGSIPRVEFDTDETVVTCSMVLCNRLQLEFYEAFERDCLRQGTKWFQMPIWMTGQIEWYNCRFVGRPKVAPDRGVTHATVSMKLQIERRNLLDPDIVEVLMIFGPDITGQLNGADTALAKLAGVTNIPPEVGV
jgi:hypothetical protein